MPWDVRNSSHRSLELSANSPSGVTPKAVADGPGTENAEKPSSAAETANDTDTPQPSAAPDDNVLFSAVTKLNDHLTTLHAALPARTAFILLSGHSDPRTMSALAARRAEYQASQNQSGSVAGIGDSASAVRWSSADERALEEAVVRTRMGLLFVGVKT
jgi:RNA exonuclease 1